MELLATRLYGESRARAHATKLYGDFLLSLSATNQPRWRRRRRRLLLLFFLPHRKQIFLNIIIIHLLHSHIHCDLDHSCSILTLHDLHFFLQPTKRKFPSIEGKFFLFHLHSWQHCFLFKSPAGTAFFKSPANTTNFLNLPPEGREVTWPGKWRG